MKILVAPGGPAVLRTGSQCELLTVTLVMNQHSYCIMPALYHFFPQRAYLKLIYAFIFSAVLQLVNSSMVVFNTSLMLVQLKSISLPVGSTHFPRNCQCFPGLVTG